MFPSAAAAAAPPSSLPSFPPFLPSSFASAGVGLNNVEMEWDGKEEEEVGVEGERPEYLLDIWTSLDHLWTILKLFNI